MHPASVIIMIYRSWFSIANMSPTCIRRAFVLSLLLSLRVWAHDSHGQAPLFSESDWASRHMAEEHHIQGFDDTTFFTLHDFSSQKEWSSDDIKRMYGLFDESAKKIGDNDKDAAARKILQLYDRDGTETVSLAEYLAGIARGDKLPDLGFGPGHHGDDEYEYEIHHWEKYHGDSTTAEELTHPEDIEHFKKHEQREKEEAEWTKLVKSGSIIKQNIPAKFLRS